MAAHTALARQLGVSEELLDALYHIDTHRHLFTARELVALRFAEIMTTSARDVDETLWDELQAHFDDGELVEIATVIGLFNFFHQRILQGNEIRPAVKKNLQLCSRI